MENWRPVVGFEDSYLVSDLGRVMRIKSQLSTYPGQIVAPCISHCGYAMVGLSNGPHRRKTASVHSLVMEAFVGPRPVVAGVPCDVNHKNVERTDNRLANLEYLTRSQNVKHAYRLRPVPRRGKRGVENHLAKLNDNKVRSIRRLARRGFFHRQIAEKFGVSRTAVTLVLTGKHWSHVK